MSSESTPVYYQFAGIARMLRRDNHYEVDQESRTVALTEEGVARAERLLKVDSMYEQAPVNYLHQLQQALRAKELYHRDKDYVVAGGEVKTLDERTGRILEGHRWPDGLHQAVEAKERVAIKEESLMAHPAPATALPGPPLLGRLDADAPYPLDDTSILRHMASEPVVGLLVARALVMELAHPKVAAAVAELSHFRRRPVNRLWRTTDAAIRIIFGGSELARHAVRHIYRVHDRISGTLPGPDRAHLEGLGDATPDSFVYTAHDATLLLWVWATLVDSGEVAFTRWVRPLTEAEAAAYYADMVADARFFGIPEELIPPDRQAFGAYLDQMLERDDLGSTPTSRAMIHEVLWLRHPLMPTTVVRTLRVLALLTLDARLADRLGLDLESNPADRRLAERLDTLLRRYYRWLPAWRRRLPYAYLALRRPTIGLGERLRLPGSAR
ncbi:MAG: DUF2236 domain-containing protein [Acidimicrobiales bacterium]|nr:DUF2236 domain-containing protein [Acidimicrobiales bacterium]